MLELTAASTAASAAITLLPGDTATPIAEKLADLSGYFLIVLCAIFLEKYLLTITSYVSFTILIPAACALGIAALFPKSCAPCWGSSRGICCSSRSPSRLPFPRESRFRA